MRTLLFPLLVLAGIVAAACHGQKYGTGSQTMSTLRLAGSGCHRDLVDADGSKICSGVLLPVRQDGCLTQRGLPASSDAGPALVEERFGTSCEPNAPANAALGFGFFFFQDPKEGAVRILCDDASKEQLEIYADPILKCCDQANAGCPDFAWLHDSRWLHFEDNFFKNHPQFAPGRTSGGASK
jgi:hypothetical protein